MELLRQWRPDFKFLEILRELDYETATQVSRAGRCAACGGRLHRADYPRVGYGVFGEALKLFSRRVSFCCAERECRRRFTPPSLRFFDRKWYVHMVVLLGAALGPRGREHTSGRVSVAGAEPSLLSVRRWQSFFREEFAASKAWRWLCGQLRGLSLAVSALPRRIFEWVGAQCSGCNSDCQVGQTIGLLAHAGLGCRSAHFDGLITIRRVWCCTEARVSG